MTQREFRNAICGFHAVEMFQMEEASVIRVGDHEAWNRFQADPIKFYLRLPDDKMDAVFCLLSGVKS